MATHNLLDEDLSNSEDVGMESNHDGQALESVDDVLLVNGGEHLEVVDQKDELRTKLKSKTLMRKLEPVYLMLKR